MKTQIFILFLMSFLPVTISAQADHSAAQRRALACADSLVNAFHGNHPDDYMEMSYPGVISYYGGVNGYRQYLERARAMSEVPEEKMEMLQLLNNGREWQCVIKRTHRQQFDGKEAHVITYLVGQSTDGGNDWKFFDVALNSVASIDYIMPDKFPGLSVPQRQVIFEKDKVATSR